jgi:hypothetical protein
VDNYASILLQLKNTRGIQKKVAVTIVNYWPEQRTVSCPQDSLRTGDPTTRSSLRTLLVSYSRTPQNFIPFYTFLLQTTSHYQATWVT